MHTNHGLLAAIVVGSLLLFSATAGAENCPDCGAKAPQNLVTFASQQVCDATTSLAMNADKVEHLHKAADHLQAAGLTEEAELVRTRAQHEQQTWRRRLLSQKIAQLHTLQNEIKQLKSTLDPDSQVLLHVKILEVSIDKLQNHGAHAADLQEFVQAALSHQLPPKDDAPAACVLGDNTALLAYLEALRTHGAAKMLAEPSLITLNGQRASVSIGGEIAVAGDRVGHGRYESVMHEFGTRLQCTPELTDDGGLRLQFSLRQTRLPLVSEHNDHSSTKAPRVLMDGEINVKLLPGQTLVLCGRQADNHRGEKDSTSGVLVVVSPEIIARVAHADEAGDADEKFRNAAITRWLSNRWPAVAPDKTIHTHHQRTFIGPPIEPPVVEPQAAPQLLKRADHWTPATESPQQGSTIVSMAEDFLDRIWGLIGEPTTDANPDLQAQRQGVYIRGVGVLPATFDDEIGQPEEQTGAAAGELQR